VDERLIFIDLNVEPRFDGDAAVKRVERYEANELREGASAVFSRPISGFIEISIARLGGSALTPPASRPFRFGGLGYMVRPTVLKERYDILRQGR
jgi:hypothetical protein